MTLLPKQGVLDIHPYVGGRSQAPGAAKIFKLSSNESPFGPSPKAVEAFHASDALGMYAEESASGLREGIAAHFKLPAERIVCGNGSNELLALIANCYVRPKDEVLMSAYGFLLYKIATLANSGVPVEVPEPQLKLDVDEVLSRVTGRTRMVYIANPNNPTGTYITASELKRLHDGLPASVLLVIDAAYAEFVNRNDYEAGAELVTRSDNVVMTRTFSKAYGLAGLRIGWLYCPQHVADTLNRVRVPFNVNAAAQRAGLAALQDVQFLEKVTRHIAAERDVLTREIRALGLQVTDSQGNFVLVHFPDTQGKRANDADAFLIARGVILRGLSSYKLPNALRLTVGTEEANRAAIAGLKAFLAS